MAWRDLWKIVRTKSEKTSNKPINHIFSDEERELSADLRALKLEKAKLLAQMDIERQKIALEKQKLELEDLKAELNGDDNEEETQNNSNGFNPEAILMTLIMKHFMGNNMPPQQTTLHNFPANPTPLQESPANLGQSQEHPPTISDQEIRNFLKSQPKNYIKLAKTLPKEVVYRKVTQETPLTNEEFERAYEILQKEF